MLPLLYSNSSHSVTSFDLSQNNITDKGAGEIAKFLEKNKTITTLNLQRNKIGLSGTQVIQKALINSNTTITQIDLSTYFRPATRVAGYLCFG